MSLLELPLLTEYWAIRWVERLIAVAIILQTVELFQLRSVCKEDGIWSWSVLKEEFREYPFPLRQLFYFILPYYKFLGLLWLRLGSAVLLLLATKVAYAHAACLVLLLISTVLISVRWRGTFNGGSDYMTVLILLALCVNAIFKDSSLVALGCLWYIAIQVCCSYFIAGCAKLNRRNWHNGRALAGFIESTIYSTTPLLEKISKSVFPCFAASWIIIGFECSFPLALLNPIACKIFLVAAVLFHLVNVYVFGLNRFLFAWLAAYPALYYCSGG